MNKFLQSFLGALAAIWLTVIILGLGSMLMFAGLLALVGSESVVVPANSILYLDLNTTIGEQRENRDLIGALQGAKDPVVALTDIVDAIEAAADDDRIEGTFIDCNSANAGLAQRRAIRQAIDKFKKSGKWVYSYGDIYTQGDYYVASAADSIFVNPSGIIDIHGLQATTIFYKGLLDKIGVEMQVAKVGTYKSAVEPFILTAPSEASKEQQRLYLTNIWQIVKSEIAASRKIPTDSIDNWANNYVSTKTADFYVKSRIADAKVYRREMLDKLKALTTNDDLHLVTPDKYLTSKPKKNESKTTIAVLYASGDIVDDSPGGIVATEIVPLILDIAEDDDIDGLVVRINSGGGSAFASEQIWDALEQFKTITGKPFYVSMSDVAASGGYYMACGANKIYAEPVTLTGSIGIFGLIPNARNLLTDKLGLTTASVATNPDGEMPTIFEPLTDKQRLAIQTSVDRGYELFVKRVAAGRKMTVEQVKAIAEGRVWDGREALQRRLIDKLGGLDDALADMAKELNVETYKIKRYPKVEGNLFESLMSIGDNIEAKAVKRALGDNEKYYQLIEKLSKISTVQARMEEIEIN